MKGMVCNVCGNSLGNREFQVREMMFGSGESFVYFECCNCKCLQIRDMPKNMAAYYPPEYYSFLPVNEKLKFFDHIIRSFIQSRNKFLFFQSSILGRFINKFFPNHRLEMIAKAELSKDHRILDVGCGNGALLHQMCDVGFSDLLGIDPFLPEDVGYQNGLKLKKIELQDVAGHFDLIMFNHSFEHMANPASILGKVALLLNSGGVCLIRIPTSSSYAWRHYGPDWVQIDAPRHLFLHSFESIKHLAEANGLRLHKVIYDSTAFQFWGSEQHKRNVSLYSKQSYFVNPSGSAFSRAQIRKYHMEAKRLNSINQGDACAFFLIKHESNIFTD